MSVPVHAEIHAPSPPTPPPPPRQTPTGQTPHWADTPPRSVTPEETPPPGDTRRGQTTPPPRQQTASAAADGTHPTGMHSCLIMQPVIV